MDISEQGKSNELYWRRSSKATLRPTLSLSLSGFSGFLFSCVSPLSFYLKIGNSLGALGLAPWMPLRTFALAIPKRRNWSLLPSCTRPPSSVAFEPRHPVLAALRFCYKACTHSWRQDNRNTAPFRYQSFADLFLQAICKSKAMTMVEISKEILRILHFIFLPSC